MIRSNSVRAVCSCLLASGAVAGLMLAAQPGPAGAPSPGNVITPMDSPPPIASKDPEFSSLLNNSPFAPVSGGGAAAGDKAVEFRGQFTEQGAKYFSIYDPSTQRAAWVAMNETGHPFVVRGYNDATDTVTVEVNGRNLNLTLKHATVQLASAPKLTAPGGPPVPQGGDNTMRGRWMANVNGADGRPDPQRMQAFIEEMRRRRASRFGNAPQGPGAVPAGQGENGMPPLTGGGPIPIPNQNAAGTGPVPVDPNGQPGR